MRRRDGRRALGATVAAVAILGLEVACGTKTDPPPGELMLAIQTDMALPADIDEVLVLAEVAVSSFVCAPSSTLSWMVGGP